MSKLQISMAFSRSARSAPILDGEVEIEGVDLTTHVVGPANLFWRQLTFQEFDVSEFSMSSLLMLKSNGIAPYSALPAFPSRAFFHTNLLVHVDAGIERPEDLKGKRVGVAEYIQTAAVWTRGALMHEFGVHPSDMEWFMGRPADRSLGTSTGFTTPPGLTLHHIPESKNLGQMLLDREIDAIVAYAPRNGGLGLGQEDMQHPSERSDSFLDRDDFDVSKSSEVRQLFSDRIAEGQRYLRATGILPINHVAALRDSLAERHPWLARNIYDAFCRARAVASQRLRVHLEPYAALGAVDISAVAAQDGQLTYGVQANRKALEAAVSFGQEQGLLADHLTVEDLFVPSVAGL